MGESNRNSNAHFANVDDFFSLNCCSPTGLHFLLLLEFYLCVTLEGYGAGAGRATEDLDC